MGYTCFNDVSQRNFQKHDKAGWFRGKSLDTFGPVGPRIVLSGDIGDPQNLAICSRLNGKNVQESNTSHMIFTIPQMIAFISKNFTLEAAMSSLPELRMVWGRLLPVMSSKLKLKISAS